MCFRALALGVFLLAASLPPLLAGTHDHVKIPSVKTSIYIGSVTLIAETLHRENGTYTAAYQAKVFPYFFFSETGRLSIGFSDEQLATLDRGERVEFTGTAKNDDGEDRRVEGHATPDSAGATSGKIKVRIFVSAKIELVFNTTYQFEGDAAPGSK
jgi:hypothetical protein